MNHPPLCLCLAVACLGLRRVQLECTSTYRHFPLNIKNVSQEISNFHARCETRSFLSANSEAFQIVDCYLDPRINAVHKHREEHGENEFLMVKTATTRYLTISWLRLHQDYSHGLSKTVASVTITCMDGKPWAQNTIND